jgi:hypothetical protein
MDNALVDRYYSLFLANRTRYLEIEYYYNGFTDAFKKYRNIDYRSNLKVKVNFLKKFIKEEVSYSLGNDINYISKSGDEDITKVIDDNFQNLSTQHDIELMKNMTSGSS